MGYGTDITGIIITIVLGGTIMYGLGSMAEWIMSTWHTFIHKPRSWL